MKPGLGSRAAYLKKGESSGHANFLVPSAGGRSLVGVWWDEWARPTATPKETRDAPRHPHQPPGGPQAAVHAQGPAQGLLRLHGPRRVLRRRRAAARGRPQELATS